MEACTVIAHAGRKQEILYRKGDLRTSFPQWSVQSYHAGRLQMEVAVVHGMRGYSDSELDS